MDKNTIIQKESQRAAAKLAYQDNFIARNYWLWISVAFILYPLATILSGLTEGGHVLIRTKTTMGENWIAWIVTILIVTLIELPKFILGKGAIDDIQAGVFSEGGAKLYLFIIKFLGFIAVMGFSIMLSIKGGPVLNESLRKKFKPVEAQYIDIVSINDKYDQEALPHHENIDTYRQTTWKGKIVSDARNMIMNEQKIIEGIEQRRNTELSDARTENQNRRQEYKEQTEVNGKWAMGFAGLGEAICIFCLVFIGIYDDGIKAQVNNAAPTTGMANDQNQMALLLHEIQKMNGGSGFKQVTGSQPTSSTPSRRIGFFNEPQMKAPPPYSSEVEGENDSGLLPWQQAEAQKASTAVQQLLNNSFDGPKVIDARYCKSYMKTAYGRSFSSKTEKARFYNKCLYRRLRHELEQLGWQITEQPNSQSLDIIEA